MNREDKSKITIRILIAVVILLVLFIAFVFIVRPSFNNYVVKQQNAAQILVINSILYQIQQQGYVQLPVGNNQTLILVPYTPPAK